MPDAQLDQLQVAHIKTLQHRYDRLLPQQGYDAVLISSGVAPMRYGDDQAHHHQGFGPFLHWTGLTGLEHSWLLIRPGHKPMLWFYAPVDFWHAAAVIPDGVWSKQFELHATGERKTPVLPTLRRLAVVGDPVIIGQVSGAHNPAGLLTALEQTRVYKTPYEIACIDRANEIAARGHRAAQAAFADGASEFSISLAYQSAVGQREVDAPYHSIIGLNSHAGTLHYQHYDTEPPAPARSLLIDAGVRHRGYCSDITRTIASPGEGRFAALIDGVQRLQSRLCDEVRPGLDYVSLHDIAHRGIAALLLATGLVQGLTDDAVLEQGITRAFFPHGLGHFLGVQVHDVAGKPRPSPDHAPMLRLTHVLEPGMVVTIEPGLYFIPSLLEPLLSGPLGKHLNSSLIEELAGCGGIRIEDNVLVTENGANNFTRRYL